MPDPHPINQTLLTLQANQARRIYFALEGLGDEVFTAEPGGDCNNIQAIGQHLIGLHKFMLAILESPLSDQVPGDAGSPQALQGALKAAADLLEQAIREHDPADWLATPATPRQGPWGDEPTLARIARPFNDLTNHLGGIRAIRRIHGNPATNDQ